MALTQRRRSTKGSPSKTRKGRQDYVTHKGSKFYNRKGHRQAYNRKGVKGRPYQLRRHGRQTATKRAKKAKKATKKQTFLFQRILGI
jgi:hypothetical protein